MDVEVDMEKEILVNNRAVDMNYLVYENFSIEWTTLSFRTHESDMSTAEKADDVSMKIGEEPNDGNRNVSEEPDDGNMNADEKPDATGGQQGIGEHEINDQKKADEPLKNEIKVLVNNTPVTLSGRNSYIFIDIFQFYDFDLSASAGRTVITKLNGENARYTAELKDGDEIELTWKEN